MALMGRTELGIREIGTTVTVPDDPTAKLMYYLKCMCTLLDMSDHPNMARLTNYSRYYSLSEEETDALLILCILLSPEELIGKVMFKNDAMCKDSTNNFYELSAVRNTLLLTGSIMLGGKSRSVQKIMAYREQWLMDNWIIPMVVLKPRLERIARRGNPGARRSLEYSEGMQTTNQTQPQIQTRSAPAAVTQYDDDSDCCCTIL